MANPGGTPANLLKGGKIGNKGGPGTPPSRIRELCREHFYEGIPKMAEIVLSESEGTSNADRIRAQDLFGKYGLGDATTLDKDFLDRVQKIIMEVLQPDENQIKLLGDAFTKEFSS